MGRWTLVISTSDMHKWHKNSHGIKFIDETTYNSMKYAIPKCIYLIDKWNDGDKFIDKFACQTAFAFCDMAMT